MKLLSRLNGAAACFVVALSGLVTLSFMAQGAVESEWEAGGVLAQVGLFGFLFIRTSLLYLREGEPEGD